MHNENLSVAVQLTLAALSVGSLDHMVFECHTCVLGVAVIMASSAPVDTIGYALNFSES